MVFSVSVKVGTELQALHKMRRTISSNRVRFRRTFAAFVIVGLVWNSMFVNAIVADEDFYDGDDGLKGPVFPLKLEPTYDQFDFPSALRRSNFMRFQFNCVFFEGPCDIVGKWLKPRTVAALFGTCLKCTKYQGENAGDWLVLITELYPVMFRAAVSKFLVDIGIPIPADEMEKLERFKRSTGAN